MTKSSTKSKPVLFDFRFLGTALLGAVSVGVVTVFGSLDAQVAMLGTWLSILAGLVVAQIQSFEHTKVVFRDLLSVAGLVPSLTERPELLKDYLKITKSLEGISAHADPVLVQFATQKLNVLADQVCALARGEITICVNRGMAYDLRKTAAAKGRSDLSLGRMVKSAEYWQDEPGKKKPATQFGTQVKGFED